MDAGEYYDDAAAADAAGAGGEYNSDSLGDEGGDAGGGGGFALGEDEAGEAAAAAATLPRVDEEAERLMANFGEHKLMERVQATLKKQLLEQLARVEAELREAEEAREAARTRREDTGVELYGVQQQLARLQNDLDAKAASVAALAAGRAAKEEQLARYTEAHAARQAAVAEAQAQLEAFKGELDGVSDTMRQVEAYNADMAAEIALNKRATMKAEGDMSEREKGKAQQDAYIDGLTQKVRRAGEQLATLQSQISAQKAEAAQAGSTMAEAAAEMEAIRLEKKQLMLQWQSTLTALRRRDEALQAVGAQLRSAQAELDGLDAEEGNARKAVAAAQAVHAKIADALEREEADLRHTESSTAALQRQHEALEQRREALAGQLDATDAEVKRAAAETQRLVKAAREVEHARFLVDKQRFGLEDEINEALSSRLTHEKAARALLKDASKLVERSHALDVAKAEAENAVAAARVEALTVSARVSALREQLAALNREVADKEALAAKCQAEIKQRHEAVAKKMTVVERLNRKWDKLADGAPAQENMGPLQAEVHNLAKTIEEARAECDALQRRWLSDHTALVAATTDTEVRATKLRELSSQATLLHQKGIRLDRAIASEQGEARRLEGAVKGIRDDMARINALIAKNAQLRDRLAAAAYSSEKAFGEELKDMEREAAAAEARTGSLKDECGRLVGDLVEAEKQVVAWEKKIQLERETQEALDPSAGESELAGMEKEVHRMRLRYEGLKREQEKLIADMERAVAKRDVIAQKHRSARQATMAAAAQTGKGLVSALGGSARALSSVGSVASATRGKAMEGDAVTKVGLEHRAAALRAEIATKLAALEEVEAACAAASEEAAGVSASLAQRSGQVEALEAQAGRIQEQLREALFHKQRAVERAAAAERMLQRFAALEAGRLPSVSASHSAAEVAAVRARVSEAEAAAAAVTEVCARLSGLHSELSDVIGKVQHLMQLAPPQQFLQ